ncbi:MAG: hypothetical protein GY792_11670, partial [Gammaproteobacteria bacterium]|nr:hypothetical protein [Gammaproteobacteria bacterium]
MGGYTWPTALLTSSPVALDTGQSFAVSVQVDVPPTLWISDTFTITATSVTSPTDVVTSAMGTTHAVAHPAVAASGDMSQMGNEGETLTYTIAVTNTGDYTDTFDVSLGASVWPAASQNSSLTLGAGESAVNEVYVTVGSGLSDEVVVTFSSQLDGSVSANVRLTSYVVYDASIAPDGETEALPGSSVTHEITLENLGSTDSYV